MERDIIDDIFDVAECIGEYNNTVKCYEKRITDFNWNNIMAKRRIIELGEDIDKAISKLRNRCAIEFEDKNDDEILAAVNEVLAAIVEVEDVNVYDYKIIKKLD